MIVLVDQDQVMADFEGQFLNVLRQRHPELPYVPLEQRTTHKLREQYVPLYGERFRKIIKEIETEPGFFLSLPPIPGSLEAVTEIAKKHDVFICTAPLKEYKHCAGEKYEWIERYLGYEWTRKIVLTMDKTLLAGNILIDDKPEITGLVQPSWEHVMFSFAYNLHITNKRRIKEDWSNWKEVLPELL